jgi:hypothetical protein
MKKCSFLGAIAVLFFAANVWAQEPARSLSDLPPRLKKGDDVTVTLRDGKTIYGRYDSVSGSTLRLAESGKRIREVPETTISRIAKPKPDSIKNGLLIGALVGARAGLVATASICGSDSECSANGGLVLLPIFTGGGIGIGALIDSKMHRQDPLFVQRVSTDRPGLKLAPLVSQNKRGVLVSMSF